MDQSHTSWCRRLAASISAVLLLQFLGQDFLPYGPESFHDLLPRGFGVRLEPGVHGGEETGAALPGFLNLQEIWVLHSQLDAKGNRI